VKGKNPFDIQHKVVAPISTVLRAATGNFDHIYMYSGGSCGMGVAYYK